MRHLEYLSHALAMAAESLRSGHWPGRRRLFTTYLRMQFRNVLLDKVLKRRLKQEHLFGLTVHFFTYWSFVYLFEEIFVVQEYALPLGERRPLIIDGGSNIGMSTLYFKWVYPDSRVIAFEPDPTTFQCLRRNIEGNNVTNVAIRNEALSDRRGTLPFYFDPKRPGSFHMSTNAHRAPVGGRCEVQSVTLSDVIDEPVALLKLDVEGSERAVIADLARSGKLRLIRKMVIEYHHHVCEDQDDFSSILEMLEDAGFGYQISAPPMAEVEYPRFQDILVYAFRKDNLAMEKQLRSEVGEAASVRGVKAGAS